MTHFKNAIAAYKNAQKSTSIYERRSFYQMAQNFTKWHIAEVGGDYLDVYIAVVAEATGYYEKAAA